MFQISSREPIDGTLIGNHVVVDDLTLYRFDYFGKGEMSRSTPCFANWFDANTASTSTNHLNHSEVTSTLPPNNMEKLILSLQEAFYLYFALGCLRIREPSSSSLGMPFITILDQEVGSLEVEQNTVVIMYFIEKDPTKNMRNMV
ncbi:hypothetical protein C9374_005401 [Naegleria lovaniensis]|uniref:tRNA intron endonuclease N-terminal domain-containing protein n=1 Tax=Naegleria lovaniensis TaxID=51637 RepID=A0AA88GJM1_NAELO|nr:uncharacterized protein C9374_005401 [Naegleria lovaniensis]KAG2382199.1 hypothetical protein C9374_005401 [Naegleria lovaniensis]